MAISRRGLLVGCGLIAVCPKKALAAFGRRRRSGRAGECRGGAIDATGPNVVRYSSGALSLTRPPSEAWNKIAVGMTEQEVLNILGEPVEKQSSSPPPQFHIAPEVWGYSWDYGRLQFHSEAFPDPFTFDLIFQQGRVTGIYDPFGRRASVGGRPVVPKLLLPEDRTVFHHFPRFLDLRWLPSDGEPSVSYDVELEFAQYEKKGGKLVQKFMSAGHRTTEVPYAAMKFVGMADGRWRVRARNHLAVSEWSEFRTFRFKV